MKCKLVGLTYANGHEEPQKLDGTRPWYHYEPERAKLRGNLTSEALTGAGAVTAIIIKAETK